MFHIASDSDHRHTNVDGYASAGSLCWSGRDLKQILYVLIDEDFTIRSSETLGNNMRN